MDKVQLILALLGSAAIGAVVSNAITAFTQHLERKSRREELLMREALGLAQWRIDTLVTNNMGQPLEMPDKIVLAETYYGYLQHLAKHGRLPDDPRIERPK